VRRGGAALVAFLGLTLPTTAAAATDPGTSGAPRLDVGAALVGETPDLRVMRRAHLLVRVTNRSAETLPGCSAAEFAHGQPSAYLGAWFADLPPATLGTFEITHQLSAPLAPGESVDVSLEVRPGEPGRRFLAFGLLRTSRQGSDYGQVGHVTSVPVEVAAGSWHENHRVAALRALVLLHLAVFVGAIVLLARRERLR
jgi:hypothetical protein